MDAAVLKVQNALFKNEWNALLAVMKWTDGLVLCDGCGVKSGAGQKSETHLISV